MGALLDMPKAQDYPDSVHVTQSFRGMSELFMPTCAAVILHREVPPSLLDWINWIDPATLPRARLIVPVEDVKDTVRQTCDACGTPKGPERSDLINDIAENATHFAGLMKVRHLRLRLDVVTTNACRKFHLDAVTARLVCTYRGQTTQLGEALLGGDPVQISSVPRACPVIFRGSKWMGDTHMPLRHRSPPIEGSGESRLLLVLDPIYDPDDEV